MNDFRKQSFELLNCNVLVMLKEQSSSYNDLGPDVVGKLCAGEWTVKLKTDVRHLSEGLSGMNIQSADGKITLIPFEDVLVLRKAY